MQTPYPFQFGSANKCRDKESGALFSAHHPPPPPPGGKFCGGGGGGGGGCFWFFFYLHGVPFWPHKKHFKKEENAFIKKK